MHLSGSNVERLYATFCCKWKSIYFAVSIFIYCRNGTLLELTAGAQVGENMVWTGQAFVKLLLRENRRPKLRVNMTEVAGDVE